MSTRRAFLASAAGFASPLIIPTESSACPIRRRRQLSGGRALVSPSRPLTPTKETVRDLIWDRYDIAVDRFNTIAPGPGKLEMYATHVNWTFNGAEWVHSPEGYPQPAGSDFYAPGINSFALILGYPIVGAVSGQFGGWSQNTVILLKEQHEVHSLFGGPVISAVVNDKVGGLRDNRGDAIWLYIRRIA